MAKVYRKILYTFFIYSKILLFTFFDKFLSEIISSIKFVICYVFIYMTNMKNEIMIK